MPTAPSITQHGIAGRHGARVLGCFSQYLDQPISFIPWSARRLPSTSSSGILKVSGKFPIPGHDVVQSRSRTTIPTGTSSISPSAYRRAASTLSWHCSDHGKDGRFHGYTRKGRDDGQKMRDFGRADGQR